MEKNYPLHEQAYKKNKETGRSGWDTAEGAAQTLKDIAHHYAKADMPIYGSLLDLGCGAGENSVWFAQQGYTVSGIDIAPTAIAWAQERAEKANVTVNFRVGSVLTLDSFADERFDIVHDGHCLHCIIGSDDRSAVLAAVKRVLKPDGVFFVGSMAGGYHPVMGETYDANKRCLVVRDIITRYIGTPEDIISEVTAAGFTVRYQTFVPFDTEPDTVFGELFLVAKR